jgi:nucleotide-binding universal stress UspA family protein
MLNLKHILFPIDFSERSAAAVPYVAAMADRLEARVTVLHVVPPIDYRSLGMLEGGYIPDTDVLVQQAGDDIRRFISTGFQGVKAEGTVLVGEAASTILATAADSNADMIAMPTHGYGPFRRLLLGSVTAKVLHDAAHPVWTGAHVANSAAGHIDCRKVLCAVDLSPRSDCVLTWAAEYARLWRAELSVLHVLPEMGSIPARYLDREFMEQRRNDVNRALIELKARTRVDAPSEVETGSIDDVVREEAARQGADLVIIGRAALQGPVGRLRTHAYGIIRESPCPVISV